MAGLPGDPIVFGLYDCGVYAMTDATSSPETYGSKVDVPGIRRLNITVNFDPLEELRGDNTVLAYVGGKVASVDIDAENAILDIEALDVIMPGVASSGGSTPSEEKSFTLATDESAVYFKIVGHADLPDSGNVLVTIYKCRAGSMNFQFQDNQFVIPGFNAKGVENAAHDIIEIHLYETETAIS